MTKRFRLFGLLPILLAGWSCGDKADVYSVSVPNLKIDPDSAIVAMDIKITAGTVQAVENIPIGWNIDVSDDASWRSQIRGNYTTGAAALAADELKKIVFMVRRNESTNFVFDISGTFTVAKNFENPRKVQASMKDFSLSGTE